MSKAEKITTGFLMSLIMAFALSGFFVLTRIGFAPEWYVAWFKGFISAWPVAFALSVLIGKPVAMLSNRIVGKLS